VYYTTRTMYVQGVAGLPEGAGASDPPFPVARAALRRWDGLADAFAEEPAVGNPLSGPLSRLSLEPEVVAGGRSTGSVEALTLTTGSPGVFCAALFLEHTDDLGTLRADSY
jgi:hypothetical protein